MSDTIAAVATPRGIGGIAVVRISGSKSFEIASKMFNTSLPIAVTKKMVSYKKAYDKSGELIDEVITKFMPAPHSFTMEDTVEIDCHGGIKACDAILEAAIDFGARWALPGEFTKRAYLNGRMDLSQAEAINELINASTQRARKSAIEFLAGNSGKAFKKIRDDIMDLLAYIEASVDFPSGDDEMIVDISPYQVTDGVEKILEVLDSAIEKASEGAIVSKGIKIAIIGSPNVGKSSLLNLISGKDRAIVSDIPGTTRDTIEEISSINGIPVTFIDTAGIRPTDDVVEKIGIDRALSELNKADIVLMVIDSSRVLSEEDNRILNILPADRSIIVLNKDDLPVKMEESMISSPPLSSCKKVRISALNGEGIDLLEREIESLISEKIIAVESEGSIDISTRRLMCLKKARACLKEASLSGYENVPVDILCIDIREGLEAMGELTGDTAREDVIDEIFAKFCIGK